MFRLKGRVLEYGGNMENYNTFSSKHYESHESNKIWRNINNDSDVESKINECERMIECKRKMRYLDY